MTSTSKIPLQTTANFKSDDFNNCFHWFNFNFISNLVILIFDFNLEISYT